MARTEKKPTSLDAVITLVDTISSKLQLVSQDYRGLDALNLELSFFHQLLLRTRYVRRSQPSFLFDLFEELRHFCLILRAERRLEYVMVEEISRFREILAIFQRRFCESNDTRLLDFVLDKLKPVDDSHDLGKLKVELKLIKLLYLCERNQSGDECQPFSDIISEIYEEANQFYFMSEDLSLNHDLVSSFRATLSKCCKQHFSELQSDSILAWSVSQLNEFHDSLVPTLWDVYIWGQSHSTVSHFIQPVINTVVFLKNFMRFAARQMSIRSPRFRVDYLEPACFSETFLIHYEVLAIDAARLGYMCWFCRDDEDVERALQSKSWDLLDKVRSGSGEIQATLTYIETLPTSTTLSGWREGYSSVFRLYAGELRHQLFQLVPVVPLEQVKGLAMILGCRPCVDQASANAALNKLNEVIVVVFQLYMLSKKDKMPAGLELRILQLLATNTSSTIRVNGIPQLLGGRFHRILAKRSFLTRFPRLTVNGVVVSYDFCSREQIKYQLLKDSAGRDLIALVTKDIKDDFVRMSLSLADTVDSDPEIIDHFKIRARCYLPSRRSYDRKSLLRSILLSIPSTRSSDYSDMCEEQLGRVLYECLQGKRYLLIVEIYKRSRAWRDLISSLPKDGNGSKILLKSHTISDPAYFSLEPNSSIHQVIGKMGSCFKIK